MTAPSGKVLLFALAGPLIWFTHLMAIYGVNSIAEVAAQRTTLPARIVVVAFTVIAVAADLAIARAALRRGPPSQEHLDEEGMKFWRAVAGLGALISTAAVIFQALPVLALRA